MYNEEKILIPCRAFDVCGNVCIKIPLSVSGFNDLDHRYHLLAGTKLEQKILLGRCSTAYAGHDAGVLLMDSRRGIVHLFSGSIAENVVNHAQRPIWTMSLKA